MPSSRTPLEAGRATVRDRRGRRSPRRRSERSVGDRVHVAEDDVGLVAGLEMASAPPSTPMRTGRYSRMYGRNDREVFLVLVPRGPRRAPGRPSCAVSISRNAGTAEQQGAARGAGSPWCSPRTTRSGTARPARAVSTARTRPSSRPAPCPSGDHSVAEARAPPSWTRTTAPSWTAVRMSVPTSSIRGIAGLLMTRPSGSGSGPEDAAARVDDGGRGGRRRRDCAATASMSMCSMTAMSPGRRRLVRLSARAGSPARSR